MQLLVGRLCPHLTQWLVCKCLLKVYQQANGKYKWRECFLFFLSRICTSLDMEFYEIISQLVSETPASSLYRAVLQDHSKITGAPLSSAEDFPFKVPFESLRPNSHTQTLQIWSIFQQKIKNHDAWEVLEYWVRIFRIWSCTPSQRCKEPCFECHDQCKKWQHKNRVLRTAGHSPTSWHLRAKKHGSCWTVGSASIGWTQMCSFVQFPKLPAFTHDDVQWG